MELSDKDRLILYNQYEILKILNPQEKEYYEVDQEILINGFKANYDDLASGFMDETSVEVSEFVIDVLQMYRTLNNSYRELNEEEQKEINPKDIMFKGFDGNEEIDYYVYCEFYMNKLNRFEELKESKYFELNSHRNMVDYYRRKLSLWKEVKTGRYDKLTLDNILYIMG